MLQVVEQGSEPFLLPFPCCFSHTVQSLGHAFPALCREHAWLSDVLLHLRPSLPNLRRSLPSFVRLVHRYYGAVRLLQHVHVRRSAYGLRGPAFDPLTEGALEISRFSCMLFLSVRGFSRLRRTGQPLAYNAAAVLPSSYSLGSRHPDLRFFEAQSARPTDASGLRFTQHLAMSHARLEVRMESLFPFLQGTCTPYNMPVYPGAQRIIAKALTD